MHNGVEKSLSLKNLFKKKWCGYDQVASYYGNFDLEKKYAHYYMYMKDKKLKLQLC